MKKENLLRRIFLLTGLLAISWLPVLTSSQAVQKAASLVHLAETNNPYFVPTQAVLLYAWSPIVVLSALLLFYSPGLFLALALNAARDIGHWLVNGLCLSLVFLSIWTGFGQRLLGKPLIGRDFLLSTILCAAFCAGVMLLSVFRKRTTDWPIQRIDLPALISLLVIPILLIIFLAPKFYWENFNGDGAHAFEASRLLLVQPFPFWPPSAGEISSFPGLTSALFIYPTSWFVRLFGELEVAARLPYLLYLPGLYGALIVLIEYKREERLRIVERLLVWLPLIIYTLAMAFSATYSPYSADIALPATQDTLLLICFFGFTLTFLEREIPWMWLYALLTYLASPNGLLLIGFWVLSVLAVYRPIPWVRLLHTALAVLASLALTVLVPTLLSLAGSPAPGQEYGLVGLLSRFAFLQWSDIHRFLYLLIPCGILPALFLFAWKRQDIPARLFTVLTGIYFFFFYFQAFTSLHYYTPVMLTPLIVFWRQGSWHSPIGRRWVAGAAALSGAIALFLSLPTNFMPDSTARKIGSAIENRFPGYNQSAPQVFASSQLLVQLFPYDWDPLVPQKSIGGSPIPWNYYSFHPGKSIREINYVIQPASSQPPPGMQLVSQDGSAALYLRSRAVLEQHRAIRPYTPAGSPTLAIPRSYLFRSVALAEGANVINLVDVLNRLGLDTNGILRKLQVKE